MKNSGQKTPFWKKIHKEHLSSGDAALFLVSFTAVFGILCHQPGGSIYFVCLSIAYIAFWAYMMFSGGRRQLRGTWLAGAILWGTALLYALINLYVVRVLGNPQQVGQFLSLVMGILYIPASALINPLFPVLYRAGYTASASSAENSVMLVTLVALAIVVCAAAFFIGHIYEKRKPKK